MRYHEPRLLQRLAAEYVLGTLQGPARRRFERLMTDSHQVRAAVWGWEQRLSPLAAAAGELQPRPQVWRAVTQRIGPTQAAEEPRWYERLGLWRNLSLAATAAALVLAVMLALRVTSVSEPQPKYVAVFSGEQAQTLWLVSADVQRGRLSVRSINATAPGPNNAYELWVLPAGGAAPRSMGLLPVAGATTDTALPPAMASLLRDAQGLAVSLEPAGGSPTGAPTGPVVYQAAVLTI